MIRHERPTAFSTMTYAEAVRKAGGIPIVLPPVPGNAEQLIHELDAFIFSGGDDPVMEPFGQPTHEAAVHVLPARQQFETELLQALSEHPLKPVLGICLGMQMMGLIAAGEFNQHLPDTHPSHADHWERPHEITSIDPGRLGSGSVYSKHRQAMATPGSLRVLATAHDGVIEAIDDPSRPFYIGVQWHPERTDTPAVGQKLFDDLISATM